MDQEILDSINSAKDTLNNAYMNATCQVIVNVEIKLEDVPDVTNEQVEGAMRALENIESVVVGEYLGPTRIGACVNRLKLYTKEEFKDNVNLSGNNRDVLSEEIVSRAGRLVDMWKKDALSRKKGSTAVASAWSYCGPTQKDSKRFKAIQTLFAAFTGKTAKEILSKGDPIILSRLCHDIESALYTHHIETENNQIGYYDQIRALKANLVDPMNPDFRAAVYYGIHSVEGLATLSSLDMASNRKKKSRDRDAQDALEACQSDWELRNVPRSEGQFLCGKCKSRKTSYIQLQTRSSDEPMTTYVTCNNCGNRWKF